MIPCDILRNSNSLIDLFLAPEMGRCVCVGGRGGGGWCPHAPLEFLKVVCFEDLCLLMEITI